MATFTKFQIFSENLSKGVHNFNTDSLKVVLSNTAPDAATDAVLADITEIAATGGYAAGGYALTMAWSRSGGTSKITITDPTITASGGSVGPFQYYVIYDDTPTSPANPLIGYINRGSELTLADEESVQLDFDGISGALTFT